MKFLVKIMLLIYMCMQCAFAAQVVLDAGHGGKDPGAVRSLNGTTYKEKDIVLDVTRHTQRELAAKGYDVAMTRNSDTYHSLDRRRAQSIFQCEKLFMSIHADAHDNQQANGGTVLIYPDATADSKRAANIVRSAISSKRMARSQRVRVLRNGNSKCASILVEIGFMSNEGDLKQMIDPQYRRNMGKKLANAAAQYVGRSKKAATTSNKPAAKPAQVAKSAEKNANVKAVAKKSGSVLTPSRQSAAKSKKETVKKELVKKDIVKKEMAKKPSVATKNVAKKETAKQETATTAAAKKNTATKEIAKTIISKKDVTKKEAVKTPSSDQKTVKQTIKKAKSNVQAA